jgi:hypothetical protein
LRHTILPVSAPRDFEILNPPKPPIWRDPKRMARRARRNFVVATVSLLCGFVSLLRPSSGYREPISLQIARGERLAWLIFVLIGCAVFAAVPTLVRARRYGSSLFCLFVVFGLWALASTDPTSNAHLTAFIYLGAALLVWNWGLWAVLRDDWLFVCSCLTSLGGLVCILSFGIGERIMILSALAALNILLLTDLLE